MAVEQITMSRKGAHHAALRRKSVKVFEGAMNVLMMRAPSDMGGATALEVGLGETGGSGATAIVPPYGDSTAF
jgi:hypothetical protein